MTLVCDTWEADLEQVQECSLHYQWGRVFQPLSATGRKLFEHIFAVVPQDKFDVIAPGLDCGRCSIV